MLKDKLSRLRVNTARRLRRLADRVQYDEKFPFGRTNVALKLYYQRYMPGMRFATILDIGANVGQSARRYRQLFPDAMIYSFEPLRECYEKLVVSMPGDARFRAFPTALGEESGLRSFHRSAFDMSSSFLEMADLHKENYPYTAGHELCDVRIERLDDVAEHLELRPDVLVKIDVQGFEDAVLRGGERTIRQAKMLVLEVSFLELYRGQMLFPDMVKMLGGWGFDVYRIGDVHSDRVTSRAMWADCVFIRI